MSNEMTEMDLDTDFPISSLKDEDEMEDEEEIKDEDENKDEEDDDDDEDEEDESNNLYKSLDIEIDEIGKTNLMDDEENELDMEIEYDDGILDQDYGAEEFKERKKEGKEKNEDQDENEDQDDNENENEGDEENEDEENKDEDENEDDDDNEHLQKLKASMLRNELLDAHPEANFPNQKELDLLTTIIRNAKNQIIDPNHQTTDILSKYEYTKIIGVRSVQIENGASPMVPVPDGIVIDAEMIAKMELQQKKCPFIICRNLNNGRCEYWRVNDLQNFNE
jgi:DNA-directed RNA polymerase subunit K/omega